MNNLNNKSYVLTESEFKFITELAWYYANLREESEMWNELDKIIETINLRMGECDV